MKKHTILAMVCGVGIVLLISILVLWPAKRTTYELPPEISRMLFSREPEEFFDTYYEYYDSCEDFRKYAEINDNGNLILRLTDEQKNAALEYYDSDLEEFEQVPGVDVAEDYTGFSITGDKDTIGDIIWNKFNLYTVHDMMFRQLFSGKDPETLSVTCTIIEESTGKVLYTATRPQEEINLSVKDWEFSE